MARSEQDGYEGTFENNFILEQLETLYLRMTTLSEF